MATGKTSVKRQQKSATVGQSIIEGLNQAITWSQGHKEQGRTTQVLLPTIDIRQIRAKMGLTQEQFALRFGFPQATLRNWEQGRSRPDTPARVLLAVIAKHPEAVMDVLEKAS